MEFSIAKEQFEPLLSSLQPFLDKKDASHITAHIYLEIADNKLILHATDCELGLKIIFDQITPTQPGKATVNGKKILDIIKTLKTGDIHLCKQNNNLCITQRKSHFELPTFIADEFPNTPNYNTGSKIDLSIKELSQDFKRLFPLPDIANHRVEITGIYLHFEENKLNVVGTDAKRLGVITHEDTINPPAKIIIPKKAITEIQKLEFNDAKTEIYHTPSTFIIKDDQYFYYCKLINGQYPDYPKIIPQEIKHTLQLPRDQFLESIKLINSLSTEVKLEITNNEIIFSSISSSADEKAQTSIEFASNIDENITIAVHSRQVLDFLIHIQTPQFSLGIKDLNSPYLLQSENFMTVIIPILL